MSVTSGGIAQDTDLTDLLERVGNLLGNGDGASGYGQRVTSFENFKNINNTDDIDNNHWNQLRTDINTCSQHQSNTDELPTSIPDESIIGADAGGTSVTRISGDTFTIDNPDNDIGINDWFAAVDTIEENASLVGAGNFVLTDTRAFLQNAPRLTQWGGEGQDQGISAEYSVTFQGGYNTTDINGNVVEASGADHMRHFFNAGGDIRISASLSGTTAKDTDWGTLLGNSGQVVLGKNATTNTGSSGRPRDGSTDVDGFGGIESAMGARQLGTGYQIIFKKNGSQAEYAENYWAVYAKRNVDADTISFYLEFVDADQGDKRPREPDAGDPAGPGEDEPVLQSTGTMTAGLDLKRPNADVVVPEPAPEIITDLRFT